MSDKVIAGKVSVSDFNEYGYGGFGAKMTYEYDEISGVLSYGFAATCEYEDSGKGYTRLVEGNLSDMRVPDLESRAERLFDDIATLLLDTHCSAFADDAGYIIEECVSKALRDLDRKRGIL